MNNVAGDIEMPLEEHVKEFRSRMIIVAVPVIIITSIVFIFSGELLKIIWTHSISGPMTIYSPLELIISRLIISLMFALSVGIPLFIYESFIFIGKGLYPNEIKFFIKIVPFSFIMFTLGALLAYFVAVPIIFKYTMFYSTDVATPQISVIKAINAIITLIIGFGLVFQFPLLFIFAIKMGLVKKEFFSGKRKFIYGAILAIALFVSPDPSSISQLLVAVVLVILFEFSLLLSKYI